MENDLMPYSAIPDDRRAVLECTVALPTPNMLRARLLRDGWKARPWRHADATIYELDVPEFDGPFILVLPDGDTIGNGWLSSVIGALRTLAGLEERPDGVRDRPAGDIAAEIVADAARRGLAARENPDA